MVTELEGVVYIVVGILILAGIWLTYISYMMWKKHRQEKAEKAKDGDEEKAGKITKAEQLQREVMAKKDADKLGYIGIICGAVGLFIFWWLGIVAISLGVGALSKKSNIGIAAVILGIIDIIGYIYVLIFVL